MNIRGWPCLVVGAGRVGERKALLLEKYGGQVTVAATRFTERLDEKARTGAIRTLQRAYDDAMLDGMRLVVAATNSPELNAQIVGNATDRSILALNASDATTTPILFPAIIDGSDRLTVAIHTHGADPARTAKTRALLARLFEEAPDHSDREVDEPPTPPSSAESASPPHDPSLSADHHPCGHVTLIGAGPGAPDLISFRGMRSLRAAEVVIMDGLLPPAFLEELGISTEGKQIIRLGEGHRRRQDEINALLAEAAVAGKRVARLKSGDPFVFGRAAEEIAFLARHRISWDAIPGITSAIAAPSAAGALLTRRGSSRSFAVTSGRCEGGGDNTNFPRADHLIVLMAVSAMDEITTRLMKDGWPAETPALLVERASLPWERRLEATLATIVEQAHEAAIRAPAVLIVGKEATTRLGERRRILFTGLDPELFRPLGDLIHWPALARVPSTEAIERLTDAIVEQTIRPHDLIVFSGKGAVDQFFVALEDSRRDARILAGSMIHATGGGTAERLLERGVRAEITDQDNAAFAGKRVLLIEETHTPASLERMLENASPRLTRIKLCRLIPNPLLGKPLPDHDAILFVSPAGERAFRETYPGYGGLVIHMTGRMR